MAQRSGAWGRRAADGRELLKAPEHLAGKSEHPRVLVDFGPGIEGLWQAEGRLLEVVGLEVLQARRLHGRESRGATEALQVLVLSSRASVAQVPLFPSMPHGSGLGQEESTTKAGFAFHKFDSSLQA